MWSGWGGWEEMKEPISIYYVNDKLMISLKLENNVWVHCIFWLLPFPYSPSSSILLHPDTLGLAHSVYKTNKYLESHAPDFIQEEEVQENFVKVALNFELKNYPSSLQNMRLGLAILIINYILPSPLNEPVLLTLLELEFECAYGLSWWETFALLASF
jgi:hypothetical protein